MKKLFLLASAALLVAACSQNDELSSVDEASSLLPVEFSTYSARSTTRATNLTTDGLKNFGVFAYRHNNTWTAKSIGGKTADFMYNQWVSGGNSSSETNSWTYSPVKYWPNNASDGNNVSFVAYAPYASTGGDGTSATEASTDETKNNISVVTSAGDAFTSSTNDVPWIKYDYSATTGVKADLLYAQELNKTKSSNGHIVATDEYSERTSDDSHVLLTFNHALARIGDPADIYVNYSADEANSTSGTNTVNSTQTTVTLHKVEITVTGKAGKVGLFDLDAQTWATTSPAEYYGESEEVGTLTFGDKKDGTNDLKQSVTNTATLLSTTNASDTQKAQNLMIIPATDGKVKVTAKVTYTVSTKDTAYGTDGKVDVTNVCEASQDVTLTQGQKLKIYLVLGLTSVKFETSVNSWESATGVDTQIDVPANVE